jgi:tetratricopeptide (TPR) repeat protein
VLAHIAPSRSDRSLSQELIKLHDMVEKLQRSADAHPQSRSSHTEAALMQYAREVIANGTSRCTASLTAQSAAGGQGLEGANMRAGGWMSDLGSVRRDQQLSNPPDIDPKITPMLSRHQSHISSGSTISTQRAMQERVAVGSVWDESDDDLDADLAKAALETGTKAFEAQDWEEAESLLQEALRVLRQLPKQQRAFCDTFDLQYKLAVCAYRTQEPAVAEEALMSLVQQSASSDEHRGYIYAGTHLLAQLYIRMGQVDRARTECERALQARRRLLGKQSDASLESTALMAHIYNLLNNHARAKSCLAMIPEARRDDIIKRVEVSLGKKMEHLDSPPLLSRSISGDSDVSINQTQSRLIASSLATSMEHRRQGPVSANILPSPGVELWQSHQRNPSMEVDFEKRHSATVTSFSSAEDRSEPRAMAKELGGGTYSTDPEVFVAAALSPSEQPGGNENSIGKTLSRKEILHKIGCQPKDPIEEAVCDGDHSAFTSLLNKKNGFWRSKLRKQLRPERVTALHFAALFGEIDMARRLLGAGFKINEVPYGYSTSLTPLKFAIGARQAGMVDFLIVNGAKPSEPDSWATLAGQLMNRSWLTKTMSEFDKEQVPHQILAILRILLKHGWDVNAPFETSGATVLHQAVTFWTGSYRWDQRLRASITSFLCEQGADPFQANTEGKTPYDMAAASGHQDLLLILDRGWKKVGVSRSAEPVELSSELRHKS